MKYFLGKVTEVFKVVVLAEYLFIIIIITKHMCVRFPLQPFLLLIFAILTYDSIFVLTVLIGLIKKAEKRKRH